MRPRVSVVIAAWNGERFLADALHSVIAQDWRPLQVIVCDDGSTDRTPEILREFGGAVEVVRQEQRGVAAARNQAAARATGDFLAFIDQDDLWEPDKTSRQMAALAAAPEAAFAYSDAWIIDAGGAVSGRRSDWLPCRGGDLFLELVRRNLVPIETLLMPAEVFRRLGGFDESLAFLEDWDLVLRAAAGGPAAYVPAPLARYRIHDANLSRRREPMLAEWSTYALRTIDRYPDLGEADRAFLRRESARRSGEAAWFALRRLDFGAAAAHVAKAAAPIPPGLRLRLLAFRALLRALPGPVARRLGHAFENRRLLGISDRG